MRGSWRLNRAATYWPPLSAFLSRSPGLLNRGPGGPASLGAGFLYCILSPTRLISRLPDFLSSLSYIIVQCPPSSCGRHKSHSYNPSMVKVIPWHSLTRCTCYLHRCISYFGSPAGSEVNIQQYFNYFCIRHSCAEYAILIYGNKILKKEENNNIFWYMIHSDFLAFSAT